MKVLETQEQQQGFVNLKGNEFVHTTVPPSYFEKHWLYKRMLDVVSRTLITSWDDHTAHFRRLYDYLNRHDSAHIEQLTGLNRDAMLKALKPRIMQDDAYQANRAAFDRFWALRQRHPPNPPIYQVYRWLIEAENPDAADTRVGGRSNTVDLMDELDRTIDSLSL